MPVMTRTSEGGPYYIPTQEILWKKKCSQFALWIKEGLFAGLDERIIEFSALAFESTRAFLGSEDSSIADSSLPNACLSTC